MNSREIPIACTLTQDELPARKAILHKIGQSIHDIEEYEDGYAYFFDSDEMLSQLVDIIGMERRCCPFLRFTLTFEPDNGPLQLKITGPVEVKNLLRSFFSEP